MAYKRTPKDWGLVQRGIPIPEIGWDRLRSIEWVTCISTWVGPFTSCLSCFVPTRIFKGLSYLYPTSSPRATLYPKCRWLLVRVIWTLKIHVFTAGFCADNEVLVSFLYFLICVELLCFDQLAARDDNSNFVWFWRFKSQNCWFFFFWWQVIYWKVILFYFILWSVSVHSFLPSCALYAFSSFVFHF